MRFKCSIINISTFTKLTAALGALGKIAWMQLTENDVRFVVQQEQGTQVWATVKIHELFDDYVVSSAVDNTINLEIPLGQLTKALRSCALASEAVLRLSKRQSDMMPILSLTITSASTSSFLHTSGNTLVTQEVPVRVLSTARVEGIREPVAPNPMVALALPDPVTNMQAIVQRFLRLVGDTDGKKKRGDRSTRGEQEEKRRNIVIRANNEGFLEMGMKGENVRVQSIWKKCECMAEEFMDKSGEEDRVWQPGEKERFAVTTVDGNQLVKVLKVSSLAKKVVVCIRDDEPLVFYCFFSRTNDVENATLVTYYMSSLSEY